MRVIQFGPKIEWFPPLIKFNSNKHNQQLQTFPQESHFQVVVLILNFELINLFSAISHRRNLKKELHSENTHTTFSVNASIEENSGRGNQIQHRDYIIFEKLRFQNVFCPRENRKRRFLFLPVLKAFLKSSVFVLNCRGRQ